MMMIIIIIIIIIIIAAGARPGERASGRAGERASGDDEPGRIKMAIINNGYFYNNGYY